MLNDDTVPVLIAGALIAWLFLSPSHTDGFDISRDYVIVCSGDYNRQTDVCNGRWEHGTRIHYAVSREKQMVIRMQNFSADSPIWTAQKMTDCSVYDAGTWDCYYKNGDFQESAMCSDGECTDSVDGDNEKHVGWFHYYLVRVQDVFSK